MALSVNNIVNVTLNLSTTSVQGRSFNSALVIGDSNVIGATERIRSYADLLSVANDFGVSAPEYQAASIYFQQSPQPVALQIGRWVRTATAGTWTGSAILAAQIANIATLSWASSAPLMSIAVDGAAPVQLNANAAVSAGLTPATLATAIQAAITANSTLNTKVTISWTGTRFVLTSLTTGIASQVIVTAATGGVSNLLTNMGIDTASATSNSGAIAETALQSVQALDNKSPAWYACGFAASVALADADVISIAAYINATATARIFGFTYQNANVLSSTVTNDLPSQIVALGYRRCVWQYSNAITGSAYAIFSIFGRLLTVNFANQNSTITLNLKQEPGIVAEDIGQNEWNVIVMQKKGNVYARWQNFANGITNGQSASGAFLDAIVGIDWFINAIQTAAFNLLYTTPTKVPQTDEGGTQIVNTLNGVCQQAVNNGLVGKNLVWNGISFGGLVTGAVIASGFYIYMAPFNTQSQADRDARIAPPVQIAVKLAGAVHKINITVNVNN